MLPVAIRYLICNCMYTVIQLTTHHINQRPNMMKFLDLMTSVSKKDRFRLMLFLKVVFKMYAETL